MAKLLERTVLRCNTLNVKSMFSVFGGHVQFNKLHTNKIAIKEIKIPVQWGHISAKVWGNDTNHKPILALHGWQENAGTWDTLAPMLVQDKAIVAIDFPGHGLSSWLPPGTNYYAWNLVRNIWAIKEYFKWDKVSLLAHSMGSVASLRFASTFPDDVDFFIAMDVLINGDHYYDFNNVVEINPKIIRNSFEAQFKLNREPPSYTMEEIKQKLYVASNKSLTLESTVYLANRGTLPSKTDPNKYYFNRDPELKYVLIHPEDKKFIETLVKRLKCPTLHIKGIDSTMGKGPFVMDICKVIEKSNPQFEMHYVPGTHHVHLNNPEIVAPLISNFFKKYNIL